METIWFKKSGNKLATLDEQKQAEINIPVNKNAFVELISGELPPGTKIKNNKITGTPYEVASTTTFRFVLRAHLNEDKKDRTFSIEIKGPDQPQWITSTSTLDLLPIGDNDTLFVLDSEPVDFQFKATDSDTRAGEELNYFIGSDDGKLPPGLDLKSDGRLVGIVEPLLALEKDAKEGDYDQTRYDKYPFDFNIADSQGFDSFYYDITEYGFSTRTQVPEKLNRFYNFRISVTDGDTVAKRKFKMLVVGDDFLRSDNTIMQVGTSIFTADVTYARKPIWLTPENLGVRRANNYVTLFLETLDPDTLSGEIFYIFKDKNNDGTESKIPPGMDFDSTSGELFGRVPYQSKVTRDYKFTVRAKKFFFEDNKEVYSDKTFNLRMLGEVNSEITWKTKSNLGSLPSNFISTLKVEAQTSVPGAQVLYRLENGDLPSGLSLNIHGEIIGKVKSFGTPEEPGMTTIDQNDFTLDNGETTIDRVFEFTVRAADHFGYSSVVKKFVIEIQEPDEKNYSNVYYKPLLRENQRNEFEKFISDTSIFDQNLIYRPTDPNFGLKNEMKMLVYAGIESKNVDQFFSTITDRVTKKRLKINDVKNAVAKRPGTDEVEYELVYLDVKDPEDANGGLKNKIRTKSSQKITADTIRTQPDNPEYNIDSLSRILVFTRNQGRVKIRYNNNIEISTRNKDPYLWVPKEQGFPVILNQNSSLSMNVFTREKGKVKIKFQNNIEVETHNNKPYIWESINNDFPVILNPNDSTAFIEISERDETIVYIEPEDTIYYFNATNIFYRANPENTVRSDSNRVKVSDSELKVRYISNISGVREEIAKIGRTELEFLPLWMRSPQEGSARKLGYTLAIPLAYCKPGKSKELLRAIKFSNFDYTQFDLEVDRFVVDNLEGESRERYIIFPNYAYNV